MLILGLSLQFVSFVCFVAILGRAFRDSLVQGLLSLCLMPYALYYMFAKLQGERKSLLVTGFLGGAVVGLTLTILGAPGV